MKKEKPSTKLCKHCKSEISYDAKVCPYCRKKQGMALWLKIVIAIVILGVLGAALGGGEESSTTDTGTTNAEVSNTTSENTTTTTSAPEETVAPTEATVVEATYGVGDVLKVGDVEYTVNAVSSSKTVGDQYLNTEANDMYLVLNVSVKNCGTEALTVSSDFFTLKNGENTYECDSSASIYDGDNSIIFETVNPDSTLTGNVIFDITQETIDSPSLQLQVQTGFWGTETGLINLH